MLFLRYQIFRNKLYYNYIHFKLEYQIKFYEKKKLLNLQTLIKLR